MSTAQLMTVVLVIGPTMLFLVMLTLALLFAEKLSNDPNRNRPENFDQRNLDPETGHPRSDLPYEVDNLGIFTSLEDSRVKNIETSGQTFVDAIMNYPGHTFRGLTKDGSNLRRTQATYWNIVPATASDRPLHPIGHWPLWSWKTFLFGPYRLAWWGWQRVLFEWKGWVFVGLNKFRRIRAYRLEYFVSDLNSTGEFVVERHVSYSDHFRTDQFQWFVPIGSAETRSLVVIKQVLSQLMWVFNPYRAAYGTDDNWGSFMMARFSSEATAVVNKLSVESVVALDDNETLYNMMRDRFARLVADGGAIRNIGFMYEPDGLTIPDRSTRDPEAANRLAGRAFANVDADAERIRAAGERDATKTRADGTAEATRKNAEAINTAGPGGLAAAQIEGNVRAVKAAPQGAVVVVGSGTIDPALAALLSKNNQQRP